MGILKHGIYYQYIVKIALTEQDIQKAWDDRMGSLK